MAIDNQANSNKYLYEFFISYSRYDSDLARVLSEALQFYGFSVWFAEGKLLLDFYEEINKKGEGILEGELQNAAQKSRRCILLASETALTSRYIQNIEL